MSRQRETREQILEIAVGYAKQHLESYVKNFQKEYEGDIHHDCVHYWHPDHGKNRWEKWYNTSKETMIKLFKEYGYLSSFQYLDKDIIDESCEAMWQQHQYLRERIRSNDYGMAYEMAKREWLRILRDEKSPNVQEKITNEWLNVNFTPGL